MTAVYVVDACRTPIGRAKGQLAGVRPDGAPYSRPQVVGAQTHQLRARRDGMGPAGLRAGPVVVLPRHHPPSEWRGLVATLENTRLHRHRPGTLSGLDRYLHERTGGMIGALSHAIRSRSRRQAPS